MKDVSFLTIFVRKKHPSHRLKPFPAYSDGMTTIYLTLNFYLSNFYFAKKKKSKLNLPSTLCKQRDHGAHPPSPKSCQNMMITREGAKNITTDS